MYQSRKMEIGNGKIVQMIVSGAGVIVVSYF